MRTSARLVITLEIDVPSTWGSDCQLGQVWTQAKKETLTLLDERLNKAISIGTVRVIGEPRVVAVLTEDK